MLVPLLAHWIARVPGFRRGRHAVVDFWRRHHGSAENVPGACKTWWQGMFLAAGESLQPGWVSTIFCGLQLYLPASCCHGHLQACNSYPESGVCDAATWRFLLGPSATPADLLSLHTGDSADEDLSMQVGNGLGRFTGLGCAAPDVNTGCGRRRRASTCAGGAGNCEFANALTPPPPGGPALLQSSNRVWLMGEQRWEDRSRVHQQQPRS